MNYCEDNIAAVNTKLQLFVEKGSVNSIDLDAFEKICQQLRKEMREHYVSLLINRFSFNVQVRKNDYTEVERDIDGFKDRITNAEKQIEESMQKLRDAETSVQSYVTKKDLRDAIAGIDKRIVKGIRKASSNY